MKKRILSILLLCCMVLTLLPAPAFAADEEAYALPPDMGSLCEHHPEHDEACGYTEGTAEIPCSHEHMEECHSLITRCVHAHTAECYPAESVSENADGLSEAENAAPTECVHGCTEKSGCILQTSDCKHAHGKDCGYAPASMGKSCTYVCEICDSKDGKTPMPLLGAARPAATQYTYTLHYDANGGSGAPPSQSVTSSEFYVEVPISEIIPTRDGYTFMGWANSRTGKPIYGGNGGYTSCLVVHGYDMSTTIYAIWEAHDHSWGEWTSNGNGTHTRTCTTDGSHTETGSCSGGKATGTEKAICETCHTAYGELLQLTKTVITTLPTLPAEGYVGDYYRDEDLKGGEAKVEGADIVVPGSFRFKHNWGGVVGLGENRMEILFTPDDAETYATAECIVTVTGIKYTITSVIEEVLPGEPLGTAFENLLLPRFVEVTTNTGVPFGPIPVTWDSSSYDPNALGEQIITGQLHVEMSFYAEELEPTSIKAIARITLIGDGGIVPTLKPPTYSRQIYSGDFCQLAFSDDYLSGGTATTADDETVDGRFTLNEEQEKYGYWNRGGGLVQVGPLALKVTFTPDDLLKYTTAECTVNVDVIPRKFRQANTSYIDNKKIGTAFEDLGLPNAFYFFAAVDEPSHEGSGLNGNVPGIIKWDDSNYDPNSYEEQTIYGTVNRAEFEKYYIVPEGADLRGVVKITLQADPVETEITQPPVFRWKNGDFTLPDNTMFVNRIFEMGATGGGSANLADGVARVKGTDTVVPGTFSFKEGTPGWFDELGENVVTVVFTPTDQHGYRTAETTIKVNVIKNTFKRCEEPDPITEKKLGTTFAGLNLPQIVVVEAIGGLRVGMEVSWEESSYDAQSTAWQTIPGTLVFDANDDHRYQQPEPAVTAAIRVKLLGSEDAPAITTTTLPGGTVGTPYHHQLQATGGGFILWELFSGELPDGLTLKQTTGEISGTPTAEETAKFTVRALNGVGNDKKELSITITNAPAAEHTVTVTNDGNGTGTATPSTAAAGTTITLTATPNAGYHLKEWKVISGGVTIVDDKFTMPNDNVEVKAIFEKDTPPVPTLESPTYSKQLYGGDLCNLVFSSLYLSGGKATVNGIEVPGMFTLDQNQEIYGHLLTDSEYLQAGPLGLKVIFTPNDQTKYAAAECTVNVNVIPRKYMYSNARYIDNRKIGTPFAELNLSNSFYFFAVGDENKPEETGMDYGMPVITKWDESSYDPNSYEEQTIYGEVNRAELEKYFTIPEGADLRGVIKVTLQADPAETEITQLPVLRWKKGEFALPDNTIFVRRQFRAETNGNETTRLVGGVVKVKGTDTVVPGTFSIKQEAPDIFSPVGEYDVNVVFTPDDPRAHIPVETSIKINVVKNTLKETVEKAPITNKALGTPFEELGLPESVWAVAVDGYIVYSLDVAWDASSYDAQSPDWQTLTGTLVLSAYKESLYQQPDPAVTAAIRVKLIGPAAAPTIITDALPDGTVGTPYSQRLFANGTESIEWRVTYGELPKGLNLNEATGEISGTPTAVGTATFTVKAENSVGSGTKDLSITIAKPQQYGKVSMGDYVYGEAPSTPSLTDWTGDGSVTYYYSTTNSNSGGTTWENIQADTLNAGTYYMYAELGETENYGSFTTACVQFRVSMAIPTYTKPTGLTAIYGQTLADVTLPDGWSWMNSSESVGNASTAAKKFMAKFTPADITNYNTVEDIELEVTVNKANQAPLTIQGADGVVYGQTLTLTTTGGSGSGAVTYRIDTAHSTGEATIDPHTGVLTPVKVGSVSVIATKAGDNDYNDITSAPFVLMIKLATPTGKPKYTRITTGGKTLKDAALTTEGSTLNPNDGKLEWVDDKGNVLPDSTRVEANKTYNWRFTPTNTNYTILTGEIELYHKSSGGGGSSSGYSYYTIKADAGTGGSISPSGNVSVREGADQTFTITPDKGCAVFNVKIDGRSIGAVKSYSFENVKRAHTIEVSFTRANEFIDVPASSYFYEAVMWAVENGVTTGISASRFDPDGICTRAQAVTFLWRTAGSPEPETRAMPFTDVPVGSYCYDAVLWAVENGITKGTSATTFSPNMTCSRAQIVAFLWRSEKSPAAGTANPFADVKSTAYYADAVLWAVKENITKGTTNTTFSPDADCTRAQIVTFLWRCKK